MTIFEMYPDLETCLIEKTSRSVGSISRHLCPNQSITLDQSLAYISLYATCRCFYFCSYIASVALAWLIDDASTLKQRF